MKRQSRAPAPGAYQPGQLLPVIDQIWAADHRLAEVREAADTMEGLTYQEAAQDLLAIARAICGLRDRYAEAGWDIPARWLNQASLAFNMAARQAARMEVTRG